MDVDAAFRVFLKVADTESFSTAAKQLGMGQPAVSKQVSALEDHLGARLLHRTTRSITLTDEGREFLGHARHAVAATDYALERVAHVKAKPTGLLRLSCQSGFARLHMVPRLGKILALYPDIDIELVLQDSWPNLVEQGIDLRIHIGEIEDETVITQLIGHSRIQLYGTPDYIAQHGMPKAPQDLFDHQIIRFTGYNRQHKWLFAKDGKQEALDIKGRVGIDNFDVLREAIIHSVGITTGPQWMFKEELLDGRIVPLLSDYDMGSISLYAAYPSRRFVPLKVRMFIDYVRTEYRAMEAMYQTCCD